MALSSFDHKPGTRPLVALAIPSRFMNRNQCTESFAPAGIKAQFISHTEEIFEAAMSPECFLVVVDLLFDQDPIGLIEKIRRLSSKEVFVLAEQLNSTEKKGLSDLGVREIFVRPVHPATLVHASLTLLKTIHSQGLLPKHVVLPAAVESIKTATRLHPRSENKSSANQVTIVPKTDTNDPVALMRSQFPALSSIEALSKVYTDQVKVVQKASAYRTDKWPKIESLLGSSGLDHSHLVKNVEQHFRSTNSLLKAKRTSLLSLRPSALWPSNECPNCLFLLASSEEKSPDRTKAIPTVLLPSIPIAFQKKSCLYLPTQVPPQMGGAHRPKDWMIDGQVERSSFVQPLSDAGRIFGALFVQFDSTFDSTQSNSKELHGLLEESVDYFEKTSLIYSQIDFLSRIYRNLPQST